MAETRATATVWNLRPEDVTLKRHDSIPGGLYLQLGELVYLTLGLDPAGAALEAEAMDKLAEVAIEARDELRRRAAERKDGSEGSDGA